MNRIKELRIRAGMKQTELADAISVSQGTISAYEKGRTEPDIYTMKKLSETLGVPVDQIFDLSDEKPPDSNYKPVTSEARILSAGVDKMPARDRERVLNMVRLMFDQYEEYFEERNDDDDPKS